MDEELQKRNTDCVYFLASPLTCKKGLECEFRHCEMARLNPRDCWYWLAGSCLNPTCAFRHPPLDGCTEASADSATTKDQCSIPVNKTNVPCYFFFNGFCNKGDRCSFLHGHDDSAPAWRSVKPASGVTDALQLENKTSAGSNVGSVPTETLPNSCENVPKRALQLQTKPKDDLQQTKPIDDLQQSPPSNVVEPSASPHISSSECEEAAVVGSENIMLQAEGFNESRSLLFSDQSSEEQVDGCVEREEWLESSPGFDVLVDDGSEKLGYEDDQEYLLGIDGEDRELNGRFLGYDYEDHVEYDPVYADAKIQYERDMHSTYDNIDNEHADQYPRKLPGRSRERVSDHHMPRKRKFMPMQLAHDGRRGVDLRDHLKNRRVSDDHALNHFSRRRDAPRLTGRSRERSQGHRTGRANGRLSSEVENNMVGSYGRNGLLLNGGSQRSNFRNSHINRRERYREKARPQHQTLSTKVSRRPVVKKRRSSEEYAMFSGPKTLAEIKEEKTKHGENGDHFGRSTHSSRTTSEDFQGPKPLSEILKTKGSRVQD